MNDPIFLRPQVCGKFLSCGESHFRIRGVTYGSFRTDQYGRELLVHDTVEQDFKSMVDQGFNVVRMYTVPPRWCLDLAQSYGLRLLVGLPWEQHVAFLDSRRTQRGILDRSCRAVAESAGHPAILGYAVGNEIPS